MTQKKELIENKEFIERLIEIDNLKINANERLILHLVSIFELSEPKPTYKELKEVFLNAKKNTD